MNTAEKSCIIWSKSGLHLLRMCISAWSGLVIGAKTEDATCT